MPIDDQTARAIYDAYSKYVYQTALFLSGSVALADDIMQDSFVKVFHSYDSYNPLKPIKPWLYKIVLNTARTALKKQSSLKASTFNIECIVSQEDPEQNFIIQERQQVIWNLVRHLPYNSKEIIILRYFHDMTLQEISESLLIPVGTCKSRLNTAIKRLRTMVPQSTFGKHDGGDMVE